MRRCPFGSGTGSPKFRGCVYPELNCFVGICHSEFMSIPVSWAAWKFWNLGNVNLIFIAPINNDLVLVGHKSSPALFLNNCRHDFADAALQLAVIGDGRAHSYIGSGDRRDAERD